MIKAVLFDLDGTLVNTLSDIALSVNYVLSGAGFPTRPTENFKQYAGNGNYKMIERALPEENRNDELITRLRDEFFEHYKIHCADTSKPYDGIMPLLYELRSLGIKCCIVSNKAQSMCDEIVPKVFGKDFEFDVVVGQQDEIPPKPQPHMAYIAMNEIDVNADECFFVGDSYTDILTGNSSGNVSVGVLWGFRDEKELREAGARFIVKEPNEILKLLKEINQM